ncbi:MAG: HEAT repeat domain-containing protein [Chloroflexota bacterium]
MRTLYIFCIIGAISLASCGHARLQDNNLSGASTEELIRLLEDIGDSSGLFVDVIGELEARGPAASEAAPALARALAYNRRDSTIASRPLVAMGPSARLAIPILLENLGSQREDVRRNSAFVLGIIGESSQCAVPELASLLWDQDSGVRSVAAAALQAITGEILVESTQELDPSLPGSVFLDEPEGNISGKAREWWLISGHDMDWPTGNCELPK